RNERCRPAFGHDRFDDGAALVDLHVGNHDGGTLGREGARGRLARPGSRTGTEGALACELVFHRLFPPSDQPTTDETPAHCLSLGSTSPANRRRLRSASSTGILPYQPLSNRWPRPV